MILIKFTINLVQIVEEKFNKKKMKVINVIIVINPTNTVILTICLLHKFQMVQDQYKFVFQ
jgi:hypothetical protein